MKRVLVVGLTAGIGGVENFICNINEFIDKEKYRMDFLTHQNINEMYKSRIILDGGNIYQITGIKDNLIKCVVEMIRFYKKNSDIDIVHLHECTAVYFVYVLPLLFNKKIKLIVHSHNGEGEGHIFHKVFQKVQNKRLNRKCACSNIAAEWMFGRKSDDCRIIHNGINVQKYRFDNNARKHIRDLLNVRDKYVIGSIARFEHQKNHMKILRIFKEYLKIDQDACLILVGSGSEFDNVVEVIKEEKMESNVFLLGNRKDIPQLLMGFDVMLMPSLYEGLPFVVLEAQATGLPVLLSDTVSEEVDLTSLIYRESLKKNDEIWAKDLHEIKDMVKARDSSEYLLQIVEGGYDIHNTVKEIEELYESLTDKL